MSATSSTELGTFTDARSVRFERLVPGPVERVWGYLTRADLLATWLAVAELDLREGGRAEFRIVVDEGKPSGPVLRGLVGRCEPPSVLSYSWSDDKTRTESWITFELAARGLEVRLILTQTGIASGHLSRTGGAWHVLLDTLRARLRGEPPAAFTEAFNAVFPIYDERAELASKPPRGAITATRDVLVQHGSLDAARAFYGEVLGLEAVSRSETLVGFEAGSLRLFVEKGPAFGPVLELLVPDLDAAKEKLLSRGCVLEAEDPRVPRCYVRDPFGVVWNLAER